MAISASAMEPMFAVTLMPTSPATDGGCGARTVVAGGAAARAEARSSAFGSTISQPARGSRPSTSASAPSRTAIASDPRPNTSGIPSPRATIETWPVGAPPARAMPATNSVRRVAHSRRIEVVGDEDRRAAVGVPEVGGRSPVEDADDPPADIADVGRARPEVLVIHGGEHRRLIVGAREDRVGGRRTGGDRVHRRLDDPGVAGEQRLCLEDGPGLVAGALRELSGEGLELAGGRLKRRR